MGILDEVNDELEAALKASKMGRTDASSTPVIAGMSTAIPVLVNSVRILARECERLEAEVSILKGKR